MTVDDFSLALEKNRNSHLDQKENPDSASIGELTIESKPAVKYLDLTLDLKMSFFEQIRAAADKAAAGVAFLSGVMANVGGSVSTRRRLLGSDSGDSGLIATQSLLLNGAEVWADALSQNRPQW